MLRVQFVQSLRQTNNLFVKNVLPNRPKFLGQFVGSALLSTSEFLPCCIRHSTSSFYGLRTVREGRRSASPRCHERFPRFIEDSLSFEGFLQSLEFIEFSEQRVRELSRSGYNGHATTSCRAFLCQRIFTRIAAGMGKFAPP